MPVNQIRRNGSYAPLSAYYYDDDAIIRAGEKAEVLYCRSLAFRAFSCPDLGRRGDYNLMKEHT